MLRVLRSKVRVAQGEEGGQHRSEEERQRESETEKRKGERRERSSGAKQMRRICVGKEARAAFALELLAYIGTLTQTSDPSAFEHDYRSLRPEIIAANLV
jgi:hypothetical protein